MKYASHRILHVTLAGALLFLLPRAAVFGASNPYAKFAGVYQSEPPAPEQPGSTKPPDPTMNVSLGADGSATVTEDPGKNERTLFGHWADSGSQVTVTFDAVSGKPAEPPLVLQSGHDGLQAATWNHAFWGKVKPPPMKKSDANWHSSHHHIL
jgi:hypothetical protein